MPPSWHWFIWLARSTKSAGPLSTVNSRLHILNPWEVGISHTRSICACFFILRDNMIKAIPHPLGNWIPYSLGNWMPYSLDNWMPYSLDNWIPYSLDNWIPYSLDNWMPCSYDLRIPCSYDLRIPCSYNLRIPCSYDFRIGIVMLLPYYIFCDFYCHCYHFWG